MSRSRLGINLLRMPVGEGNGSVVINDPRVRLHFPHEWSKPRRNSRWRQINMICMLAMYGHTSCNIMQVMYGQGHAWQNLGPPEHPFLHCPRIRGRAGETVIID